MSTPIDFETAHEYASAARQLLEHKALIKAFSDLEKLYFDQWLATPSHELEALCAIKARQDGLIAFRANLEAALSGGRIEYFNRRTRLRNESTK